MAKTDPNQIKAAAKWNKAHAAERWDRIALTVPAGRKKTVQDLAKAHGMTVCGYINTLIRRELNLTDSEWDIAKEERLHAKASKVSTEV